ncbi:hypothetical protein Q8W37_20510 [Shimia thalassica]|uniref:Uncharacterized protein n=1 Tax=Shimia thalassica TaxID=1715693 RepID=A0A0P1IAL2_9RHOB|nr:hypothetical protein [Shimia thalassica]PHO02256.1 hypothetical protein CSC82_17010 [Rhodobacteraceae bacterium 4F10]MBU2942250.1 hypothetical protein [Shimia thalassica]MDO6481791.1 hypothetical protein [Shimia thalassica]MDO6505165.1 hypothetical protein [Shimia thalassica]MDO6521161.1 hypothetical protein [Shimia thalassica]
MNEKRTPVFLERQSYRRRRLIDSIRMVPIIGALLWAVPMLWPTSKDEAGADVTTSDAFIYLFGCWLLLVICGFAFARFLKRSGLEDVEREETSDEDR